MLNLSVLAAIHPEKKDPLQVAKYRRFQDKPEFTSINIPVRFQGIPRFKKQNEIPIFVYVLNMNDSYYLRYI